MLHQIKFIIGFLLIGTAFLYACRSKDGLEPEFSPDYITIMAGESVAAPVGLTVIADTVNVSLCPVGANCFAPNSASVALHIVKGTRSLPVRLFAWIPNYTRRSIHPSAPPDSISVELDGQQYKLILRDGRSTNGSSPENLPKQIAVVQITKI